MPPPRYHSQGCNTLVAIASPRFWVRDRFTKDPCRPPGGLWSTWSVICLQPRSWLSNFFSAADTVALSLYDGDD